MDVSPARARIAIAILSGAALFHELLLTRVFSATLYYHYAFLAVSIALLGGGVGAALVQTARRRLARVATGSLLAWAACAAAAGMPASLVVACQTPFSLERRDPAFDSCALVLGALALPFAAVGAAVAWTLDRVDRPGFAYAADLAGAALACAAFAPVFNAFAGPRVVFAIGGVAGIAAAVGGGRRWVAAGGVIFAVGLALAAAGEDLVRPRYRLGRRVERPEVARWSDLGEVRVGAVQSRSAPFGWGLSPRYRPTHPLAQARVEIDSGALTILTGDADGDVSDLDFLAYDLTNLAHHARPRARTLVLGAGGGRDVLAALLFGDPSITAVEVNPVLVDLVAGPYGEFTGHLDRRPGVRLVRAEARSFLERTTDDYDLVVLSLTDTAAATGAGSFEFVESGLYTVEGVSRMLRRLAPGGLLSISRWWYGGPTPEPVQGYRLAALVAESLAELGARSPSRHVFVARTPVSGRSSESGDSLVNVIVSREPLAAADVQTLERTARRLGFGIVASPSGAADEGIARILDDGAGTLPALAARHELRAPRDDWPFFFHTEPLAGAPSLDTTGLGQSSFNVRASEILFATILACVGFAVFFVGVPAVAASELGWRRPRPALVAVFALGGLGFMLAEIALSQRLTVFLGRPTRAVGVVLAGLMISSGLGGAVASARGARRLGLSCAVAAAALGAVSVALGPALAATQALPSGARSAVAIALIAPLGFSLGGPIPLALARARAADDACTPFYWGVNAVASVGGAGLAVALSLELGFRAALLAAGACYLAAALCAAGVRGHEEAAR